MRMKAAGWMMAALVSGALGACGGGKQEAAVALDEARLSVSSARKAGAESSSRERLAQAVTDLAAAEENFKSKDYSQAQDSARKARDAALQAEKAAKAAGGRPPSRPKRRAGK